MGKTLKMGNYSILKKSTEIEAPVDKVWKIFAYPENVLRIFEELKRYEVLSQNRIGEGATYRWVVRYFGKDFELTEKITEWKENEKLSGRNISLDYEFTVYFEPTDCGTKVTVEIRYKVPYSVLGKIFNRLVIRSIGSKSYEKAFENAKKLLGKDD